MGEKKVIGYINSKGEFVPEDPAIKRAVDFHNKVVNNKTQNSMAEKDKQEKLREFVVERKRPERELILTTITKGELKKQIAKLKPEHLTATNVTFKPKAQSSKEYYIEDLNIELENYSIGDKLTKKEVLSLFNDISAHKSNSDYYVGITCNPNDREDDHNADFLAVVDCPSMEAAKELERLLDKEDYDAGKVQGNVHKSSSKKVYIYRKTPKTKE